MFKAHWTRQATSDYEDLRKQAEKALASRRSSGKTKTSRQEGLFKQVHKAIGLLLDNPKHPSLNTHEFESLVSPFDAKAKVFEAYAQNDTPGAYRIFWCYGPSRGDITIIAITPHP